MQLGYHGILEKYDEEIEGVKMESFHLGVFFSIKCYTSAVLHYLLVKTNPYHATPLIWNLYI